VEAHLRLTSPKTLRDQIISILQNADPKNGESKSIKKIFKGEPPQSRWPGFPWGWVEWAGGPLTPSSMSVKARVEDRFFVVVVDKHVDADRAEDSVMDFADSVEAALDADPTIGGLVATSYVVNREKEKRFLGDYSLVALRITLYTRRRE